MSVFELLWMKRKAQDSAMFRTAPCLDQCENSCRPPTHPGLGGGGGTDLPRIAFVCAAVCLAITLALQLGACETVVCPAFPHTCHASVPPAGHTVGGQDCVQLHRHGSKLSKSCKTDTVLYASCVFTLTTHQCSLQASVKTRHD